MVLVHSFALHNIKPTNSDDRTLLLFFSIPLPMLWIAYQDCLAKTAPVHQPWNVESCPCCGIGKLEQMKYYFP